MPKWVVLEWRLTNKQAGVQDILTHVHPALPCIAQEASGFRGRSFMERSRKLRDITILCWTVSCLLSAGHQWDTTTLWTVSCLLSVGHQWDISGTSVSCLLSVGHQWDISGTSVFRAFYQWDISGTQSCPAGQFPVIHQRSVSAIVQFSFCYVRNFCVIHTKSVPAFVWSNICYVTNHKRHHCLALSYVAALFDSFVSST